MKLFLWAGLGLFVIGQGIQGYKLYTENTRLKAQVKIMEEQGKTQRAAIEKPAKALRIVTTRLTKETITEGAKTIVRASEETTGTEDVSTPYIPSIGNIAIGQAKSTQTFSVAAGLIYRIGLDSMDAPGYVVSLDYYIPQSIISFGLIGEYFPKDQIWAAGPAVRITF